MTCLEAKKWLEFSNCTGFSHGRLMNYCVGLLHSHLGGRHLLGHMLHVVLSISCLYFDFGNSPVQPRSLQPNHAVCRNFQRSPVLVDLRKFTISLSDNHCLSSSFWVLWMYLLHFLCTCQECGDPSWNRPNTSLLQIAILVYQY